MWSPLLGFVGSSIPSNDLVAAEHIISQLWAPPNLSLDLVYSISVLEIDLKIRQEEYSKAMELLETLATRLTDEEADIYQRVKLMTLKARLYEKAGTTPKGFSVALRAATLAYQTRLLPALWEAVGALCAIFNSLKEFDASITLLQSIIPQALECEDCDLSGRIFALLADAYVGTAGQVKPETAQRKEHLTKALDNIDRSFDEYSRIDDIRGQCEMMAKKATIMHLNGDPVLANDCAAKYLDLSATSKALLEIDQGL